MILITLVELHEVAAPTPYAYNQIAVELRVCLRIEQTISIERIELQLMTSKANVRADKHRQLLNSLLVAEDTLIQLDSQRTTVDNILEVWLCK